MGSLFFYVKNMKVYDLDLNEQVDIIKIWDNEYKIWDIPPKIINEIIKIPTIFTSDKTFFFKWIKIIEKILKIKNTDLNMDDFTVKHIKKIIEIISNRVKND